MSKTIALLIIACLAISLCINTVSASTIEIDKVAVVDRVIDGDTFVLDSGERVRFADVNTPEVDEVGYQEAKDFVISKVEGKTVYLDIDDISRTDSYGRLICVVYFEYDSTQYENLNKALLVANLAEVYDFSNNEFNPYSWDLYVSKSAVPEFPFLLVIPLLLSLLSVAFMVRKKQVSNRISNVR